MTSNIVRKKTLRADVFLMPRVEINLSIYNHLIIWVTILVRTCDQWLSSTDAKKMIIVD
jgi:hypothetical protein